MGTKRVSEGLPFHDLMVGMEVPNMATSSTYDLAKSPTDGDWMTVTNSLNSRRLTIQSLEKLWIAARGLRQQTPYIAGAVDSLLNKVVGRGVMPTYQISNAFVNVLKISPNEAEEFTATLEDLMDVAMANLGVNGEDGASQLKLVLDHFLTEGDGIAHIYVDEVKKSLGSLIPVTLKPMHPLTLYPKEGADENLDQGGIMIDGTTGRIKNYTFRSNTISDGREEKFITIDNASDPMSQIAHMYRALEAGIYRGIPWFYAIGTDANNLENWFEARLVAAKIAACFSVFINSSGTTETNITNLTPGSVIYGKSQDKITTISPPEVKDELARVTEVFGRKIASGLNVPAEEFMGDFSKVNFASAKMSNMNGIVTVENLRHMLATSILNPLTNVVIRIGLVNNVFKMNPQLIEQILVTGSLLQRWTTVGEAPSIEPEKDLTMSITAVANNFSTLEEELLKRGRRLRRVLPQRQLEMDQCRQFGLPLNTVVPGSGDMISVVDQGSTGGGGSASGGTPAPKLATPAA